MVRLYLKAKCMGRQTEYEPKGIDDQIDAFDELNLI
jgi:hypothetical protein